jgi:glucose/arabinose dehydrogenase
MQFPKFGFIPWLFLGVTPVVAQINAGTLPPTPSPPFKLTKVAQFDLPWRIAFLPDGRMLITEKIGKLFLVTQTGRKLEVTGVPPVQYENQNGLLGVYLAPSYSGDGAIYLT